VVSDDKIYQWSIHLWDELKHSKGWFGFGVDELSRCTLIRPHLARLLGIDERAIKKYDKPNAIYTNSSSRYSNTYYSAGYKDVYTMDGREHLDKLIEKQLQALRTSLRPATTPTWPLFHM